MSKKLFLLVSIIGILSISSICFANNPIHDATNSIVNTTNNAIDGVKNTINNVVDGNNPTHVDNNNRTTTDVNRSSVLYRDPVYTTKRTALGFPTNMTHGMWIWMGIGLVTLITIGIIWYYNMNDDKVKNNNRY
jgi:hypothetical protein